jgi:hypothetical protein
MVVNRLKSVTQECGPKLARTKAMKKNIWLPLVLVLALGGCYQGDSAHRDETPGEKAGRAAYQAQQDAKKAAKELSTDLKAFGRDAHEGYEKQKQKDQEKKTRDGTDVPKDER